MPVLKTLMTPRRAITVVVVTVLSMHYFISTSSTSTTSKSFTSFKERIRFYSESLTNDTAIAAEHNHSIALQVSPNYTVPHPTQDGRANATFVFLCRNGDINGVVASVQSMEDRFNRKYNYPWVFLNDEPFTEEFKERVSILTVHKFNCRDNAHLYRLQDAPISFGLIPSEHWRQADWIDEDRARRGRQKMVAQRIIYGGSVPYRNMCRFNSGFFYRHPLLEPYRYYWRVEPNVDFFCDVDYDPFKFLQEHDKVYGFTISLLEHQPTVPTLWDSVKEFMVEYPHFIEPQNAMDFISNDGGNKYNLCHFWSNFEIADMDFWRSEPYTKFFEFLEAKGGFYYERWGDAPVHSIAASLFARRDQIHFFRDIGYRHESFQHCPSGKQWSAGRCACDSSDSFDYTTHSCLRRFEDLFS